MDKYQALGNNLFGFELFEEIFLHINGSKDKSTFDESSMFNAGVASAEAAVRRLREEYYNTIKEQLDEQESK